MSERHNGAAYGGVAVVHQFVRELSVAQAMEAIRPERCLIGHAAARVSAAKEMRVWTLTLNRSANLQPNQVSQQ